jgi:TP901 family phage tail tape measure protein
MADEQIVTNIVATSDFSNLITDLNKVSSALSKLQDKLQATNKTLAAQVAVMNRSFADTLRSTGQFSTHFVSLTSDVDKFGQQLDRGQMKLGQFFRVYAQHAKTNGGLIRDLAKQQVQMQNAVLQPLGRNAEGLMQYNVHIPRGIDLIKNKTAIARQELQIMNKVVQEGANQLINWGKNTQWAGRQLTVGLTVPMAAFGKASADAFRTADEQLVRLTKVYGGISQTSSAELLKVRKDVIATAREISKSMGSSFTETIGLAADIAATGKTGNELLKSVQETTRLAVLGEVDRQEAMKATLAIQTAFKSNTEELTASINFLNAVENQTSTTLNDLVEAIPKAGPIVKGLGGDVKDLALYLTAMREGGISASEGANALKSALASLINPTNVALDKFAGFGINLKDIVQKNAGDTTATILELQAALDTLNPLQKQQALEQLFGKFQFARMNALFENLGRQGSQTLAVLDLMKASSQDLANLAGRELAQVTESASGRYRRALEGLKADLAAVGDQFLNINTHLINFIDGILKFVQKLPDPIKKILGVLGMFTAAAGPIIMLTGVLGNFFGYIIKGVSHMRALFKGGEGWKLLTPEILAAQRAGDLVEQTFYSDAKAAAVLKQAIAGLSGEFTVLQQKANSAAIAVNPGISTIAGNVVMAGGGPRVVNPAHPLVGAPGTRAAAHHIPRSIMNERERLSQTIHSFTPAPIPLNQKIGAVPQIFTEGDLPRIEGLTTSRGASTGIVAGEAAKWHAMLGSLAMLTKSEVAALKKEIATTGTFSTEINTTFSSLLPHMTKLTSNAAAQSAAIVAELQAGKITVEAAKARIIAVNAQLETMMAQTTTQVAADLGRTVNLTQVPLIDQPVVSSKGKANIKELFRAKRPSARILDTIARVLGVRTFGGGYSTETTIPKKMATGGIVPGVGNSDTYPTTLPEGAFVVNKQATAQNMDIIAPMLGMNMGGQVPVMLTPGEAVIDPQTANANLGTLYAINGPGAQGSGYNMGGYVSAKIANSILSAFKISSRSTKSARLLGNWGMLLPKGINSGLAGNKSVKGSELIKYTQDPSRQTSVGEFLAHVGVPAKEIKRIQSNVAKKITESIDPRDSYNDAMLGQVSFSVIDKEIRALESRLPGISLAYQKDRMTPGRRDTRKTPRVGETQAEADRRGGGSPTGLRAPGGRKSGYKTGTGGEAFAHFTDREFEQNLGLIGQSMGHMVGSHNTAVGGINPKQYSMPSHGRKAFLGMPLRKLANGWSNPRYIGRDPQSEALKKKWRMGYNSGGLVGGLIPARRQYNAGGLIASSLMGLLGYQGGSAIGSKFGGETGSYVGGMLGSMAPMMMMGGMGRGLGRGSEEAYGFYGNKLDKSVVGNTRFAASLANTAAQGSKVSKVLMTLVGGLTKTNLVLAGVTSAAVIGYKQWQKHQESLRLNALSYGMTAEAAQKAGLQFTDYNAKIKDSINNIKAVTERNKLLYESMASAGKPIKMTIEEYKKLRKEVKSTMSDYVKAINDAESGDLASMAERLKTQFIAAGMSADEAAKKIYIAFTLSNKAVSAAASTVGNLNFNKIIDAQTAVTNAMQSFNKATQFENAKTQAQAFNTALTAVDASLQEIVSNSEKKAKADKTGKTEVIGRYAAEKQMMDQINSSVKGQKKLTTELINELAKQNPLIRDFATEQDTVLSLWTKMRLAAQGYTGDLSMGAREMAAFYTMYNRIASTVEKENRDGALKSQYVEMNRLQEAIKKATAAAQGQTVKQQIDSKKAIEAIDARIAKIKEEADARRKALSQQQQDEDVLTQIKKKQLEYQEALSSGDMSRAAQAQLDIQSLNRQQQVTQATRAIDEKEALDIKKLQAQRDALSKKTEDLANKSALAAKSLSSLTGELNALIGKVEAYNSAITNYKAKQDAGEKITGGDAAAVVSGAKALGVPLPEGTKTYVEIPGRRGRPSYRDKTPLELAKDYLPTTLDKSLQADKVYITAKEIVQAGGAQKSQGISVTQRAGSRGYMDYQTSTKSLMDEGIKLVPGTTFVDSTGKRYKILGNPSRSGSIQVTPFAMGGMVTSKPMSMPRVNRMGMGGPVINSVPRYGNGGSVYASRSSSSSSSVTINTLSIEFPNSPANAKEFYAQIKEIARQEGTKVLSGGKSA